MQALVLAACMVGTAHSFAALASARAFVASTDASASASACSCRVSSVAVAAVAAIAAVAIAAAGVGCIVLLKELTKTDKTQGSIKEKSK